MPKKTATARGAAQRNKPRVQKSVELVRQRSEKKEIVAESIAEPTVVGVSTSASPVSTVEAAATKGAPASKETHGSKAESLEGVTSSTPKASAAARLAARRQASQKTQRTAVNLISAEHYSYVRKDLVFIAILAAIMFSVIIILHFVPAIGG